MAGAGRRQRMAGEVADQPGFWASLGDNAYTRAWRQAVDNTLITPVELAMASGWPGGDRMGQVMKRMTGPDGQLTGQGQRLLEHVVASPDDGAGKGERLRGSLDGKRGDELAWMLSEAAQKLEGKPLKEAMGIAALRDGVVGYSAAGDTARQFVLGTPLAAYGIPLAGAGMAAWGLNDVLAAQQQAEKESQLPLQ